jgi:hypothetical protein
METAGEKYYGGVGETPEKEALLILSFTNTFYKIIVSYYSFNLLKLIYKN